MTDKIPLAIEIHPLDLAIIEQAAAETHIDLQAFAELAIYSWARDTLASFGYKPRYQPKQAAA